MARRAVLLLAAAASLLAALSLTMPYAQLAGVSSSGFKLLTRADALVLAAALVAAGALAGAALTDSRGLASLGLAAAAVALGGLVFTGMELVHQLGRPARSLPFDVVPDVAPRAEVGAGAVVGIAASAVATLAALASAFLPQAAPPSTAENPSPGRPFAPAQRPAPAAPATAPAGWYDDPQGAARRRYWDGGRWTEHVES